MDGGLDAESAAVVAAVRGAEAGAADRDRAKRAALEESRLAARHAQVRAQHGRGLLRSCHCAPPSIECASWQGGRRAARHAQRFPATGCAPARITVQLQLPSPGLGYTRDVWLSKPSLHLERPCRGAKSGRGGPAVCVFIRKTPFFLQQKRHLQMRG